MGDRKAAQYFIQQGLKSANDKTQPSHIQHSYTQYVSACYADPTWGTAFYTMGCHNHDLKLRHAAIACNRRALECEQPADERAKALCNLGWNLHRVGQVQEARAVTEQAVELDPALALAWTNLSGIYLTLNREKDAVVAAQKGFELEPKNAVTEMALAFALLFDRQFQKGFEHFERRYEYALHNYLQYPYPKWRGEAGKTVFLVADQGLGDTLSFARFVPLVAARAKYVHLCVQPQLIRLFQHAFMLLRNVNVMPSPSPFPPADAWTTTVSMPYALGLSDDEFRNTPHVDWPRYSLPKTWKVLDRKLHVGIAWGGSALNDINPHRSIPVTQFLELQRVPGVQLYSLQVDENRNDMHRDGCAAVVRDLAGYVSDVVDTLALLSELDMVICCESALGHIAALADKECWIPYSLLGKDYRAGVDGRDPIWTPRHRFFRQGIGETWEPVFSKIVDALRSKLDG